MRALDDIAIRPNQRRALKEARRRIGAAVDVEAVILFGSVARGDDDHESDADLLVVTTERLTRTARHEITDILFEVNLLCDTNLSTLVVDRDSWENGMFSVLPIRDEIRRDGVVL